MTRLSYGKLREEIGLAALKVSAVVDTGIGVVLFNG